MDARVKQLVNMIEDARPVAVAVLAKRLEVSERAVRNYIHRANDNLAGVARIVGSKGQYRIDVARADELARLLDGAALAHPGIPDTRDGRVSFLLNDLLMRSQWVTIEEYADLLYVSARTLSNDMRLVGQKLAQFDLTLEKRPRYGIRVAGGESQRRLCLASLVRPVLPDTDDAKLAERLRAIAACVDDALTASPVTVSSLASRNLIMHLYIALCRIEQGCYVPAAESDVQKLEGTREYAAAFQIAANIKDALGVSMPREEVAFIAIHLLGRGTGVPEKGSAVISDEMWEIASEMVRAVNDEFRFDFSGDLELRMNLARHIGPLGYRLEYHMHMDNPMLPDIKTRFPLAYSMAAGTSQVLERHFGSQPSDEELGYIAMAFALALEQQADQPRRKRILIVCASGAGSARMLEHQYRKQFGMYIDSIETCDVARVGTFDFSHIDYVFTTVPLNVKLPVPVREADFFLETSDVNAIRKVLSDDTAQSDSVSSFFSRALFFNRVEAPSKQAVLRYLSERAVESGRVDAQFAQEVAERESASATSFGNGVAMPHGMHPLSAEAFVTVGLLEHPILWDEYGHEVDIVFMVSFARSGGDEARILSSLLAEIFMDRQGVERLRERRSWHELMALVQAHTA